MELNEGVRYAPLFVNGSGKDGTRSEAKNLITQGLISLRSVEMLLFQWMMQHQKMDSHITHIEKCSSKSS